MSSTNNGKMPLFSIIIPVYNVEKYIYECVLSIVTCNSEMIEVILIDDGSNDSSGELCDNLSREYDSVRVIHKKNGGLSDARNIGVQHSKGKYLLFVDGDDKIAEGAIDKIADCIRDNDFPDVVFLECVKFFDDSDLLVSMNDGITSEINSLRGDDLLIYLSKRPKYPASACTKAIRRDFFVTNDLFFEVGLLSEDLEWAIRVFLNIRKVSYCDAEYYYYRQGRKGSISNTMSEKNVMDIVRTIDKWTSFAIKSDDDEKRTLIASMMEYTLRLVFLYYDVLSKNNKQKARKMIHNNKWILGNRIDRASKLISNSYKISGMYFTNRVLKLYMRCRKG